MTRMYVCHSLGFLQW